MASIRKRGDVWQALVHREGPQGLVRRSASFTTKAEAVSWSIHIEAEILAGKRGQIPDKTFGELLERYAREVSPSKRGCRWEQIRLKALALDPIASARLGDIAPQHFASWRDRRLRLVSTETVRREWTLLSCACTIAVREWRWLSTHPMVGVKRPERGIPRERILLDEEVERLLFALGYSVESAPQTRTARTGAAFLFALATAMRCGEICTLRWQDIDLERRICYVQSGKTSAARRAVPLWPEAIRILKQLPKTTDTVFDLNTSTIDALFRKAKARALIDNATFHDTRHTAITRMARLPGMDVLSLAKIIGHRDLKQLLVYFNPRAEDLVKLMDIQST